MSSNKSEDLLSTDANKEEPIKNDNNDNKSGQKPIMPPVIVIDKNGRVDRSRKLSTSLPKYTKIDLSFKDTEIIEIDDWELPVELINQDLLFFVSFICLMYLIRALYVINRLFYDIDKESPSYDITIEYVIYFMDMFLAISLIIESLTGYLFSWKMYLIFAFPFVAFISITCLLMSIRIMALIDNHYKEILKIRQQNGLKLFEDDTIFETTIDCLFILLNVLTAFCISPLYRQINQTLKAVEHKPETILINDQLFDKYIEQNRCIYRNRRTQTESQRSLKSIRSVKSVRSL